MLEKNKRIFVIFADMWKAYEMSLSGSVSVWHENAEISDEGKSDMMRLYKDQLEEVNFEFYGSSPFRRAYQAAEMLSGGNHVFKFKELGSAYIKDWNIWHRKNRKVFPTLDCEMLRDVSSSALLRDEGDQMYHYIKSCAERIKQGQNVLLVSHGILVRCAAAYANVIWPCNVEFNGIIFHFNESKKFIKCEFIPHRI